MKYICIPQAEAHFKAYFNSQLFVGYFPNHYPNERVNQLQERINELEQQIAEALVEIATDNTVQGEGTTESPLSIASTLASLRAIIRQLAPELLIDSVAVTWDEEDETIVVTPSVSGGFTPYVSEWELEEQTLTVAVTDALGSETEDIINLAEQYPITINSIGVTWDEGGFVFDLDATGGIGDLELTYTRDGHLLNCTVTDRIGITAQQQLNLRTLSPLTIDSLTYEIEDEVAVITCVASGGYGVLTYTLGDESNTTGIFNRTETDTYTITVTDEADTDEVSDSIAVEFLDIDTTILLSRYANSYPNGEVIIIDEYIKDLKAASLYPDKLSALYMMDIPLAADSLLNIVTNANNCTLIDAPAYTRGKGWKGDKSNDGINTNYNSSTDIKVSAADFSFGAFFHNLYGLNTASMGCRTSSSAIWALIEQDTSNKRRVATGGSSYITPVKTSFLDSAFISVNIKDGNFIIYKNGLEITPSTAQNATAFVNLVWHMLGYNNNGTFAGSTDRSITDAYFGKSLTPAEHLALYNAIIEKNRKYFGKRNNTESFLSTFNKAAKPLHKLMVAGDSIMANETGGAIPILNDEGDKYRPMRLTVNNVARRIYDKMSWNKATHIRVDANEWTKSGIWTVIAGERIVFEPSYNTEKYHQSVVANSYIEITVPDGVANFAFICMRDANFDTLTVTLNGGSISAYGNSTVNCNRTRLTGNEIGNAFHTEEYIGLPAGANVIRIAKGNNTNPACIWGGFHWNGNTLMVYNIAHGGKTMARLYNDFLTPDFFENSADSVVFEMTLINELTQSQAYDSSFVALRNIVTNTFNGKDYLLIEPAPIGINVATGLNSYLNYSNPNMEQTSWVMRTYAYQKDYRFHNTFQYFKEQIEADGGTLEGGEGGLTYTSDGVHLNQAGNEFMFSTMEDLFELD